MENIPPGAFVLAGIIACMAFVIAIIAISLEHQRRMAGIKKRNEDEESLRGVAAKESAELRAVRQEMAELKAMLHVQMIANDNLTLSKDRANAESSIQERLKSN